MTPPFVQRPEPNLRLVRAANPSAMTGSGTNSYILGTGDVAVIDPGPDDPAHLKALLGALDRHETVTKIIVTHAHLDHSAMARPLAEATGAPVLAFGRSSYAKAGGATTLSGGGEGLDRSFSPDQPLDDGDLIAGTDWALRVLHTPGHLGDHLCLGWGDLCFSGDHVMGWSSSVISPPEGDMGAYMQSLARLANTPWRRLFPGHGEAIDNPAERIAELLAHRRAREGEILALLHRSAQTLTELTTTIYHAAPAHLHGAAQRNVLAHLIDLESRKVVIRENGLKFLAIKGHL